MQKDLEKETRQITGYKEREREKNGSLKSVFDYIYLYLLFVCLKKKEEEEERIII